MPAGQTGECTQLVTRFRNRCVTTAFVCGRCRIVAKGPCCLHLVSSKECGPSTWCCITIQSRNVATVLKLHVEAPTSSHLVMAMFDSSSEHTGSNSTRARKSWCFHQHVAGIKFNPSDPHSLPVKHPTAACGSNNQCVCVGGGATSSCQAHNGCSCG